MEVQPKDPSKKHFYFSMVKSGFRIVAAITLMDGHYYAAGLLLAIAELLGIAEELV